MLERMQCEQNVNYLINDIVKISGKKNPNLGTLYFYNELMEYQKNIKPVKLSIEDFSILSSRSSVGNFYFKINAKLSKPLDYELDEVRQISYDIENSEEYTNLIKDSINKNYTLGREV